MPSDHDKTSVSSSNKAVPKTQSGKPENLTGNTKTPSTHKIPPNELKAVLSKIYHDNTDYAFDPPVKAGLILKYLITLAQSDNRLSLHDDILTSANLLLDIEHGHHRMGGFPHKMVTELFQAYNSIFDKKINQKDQHLHFQYKSQHQKLALKHAKYLKQQALVALFGRYISNNLPQNPLSKHVPILASQETKEIFANTYPPYAGEPEAKVAKSNTIKSMETKDRISLYRLFSAEQLIKDFKEAFPWAVSSNKLKNPKKVALNVNLLGTETLIKPRLQMQVLQLALLSIDLIGKSVGVKGDKIVEHYGAVDSFIQNLDHIAQLIDHEPIDNKNLKYETDQKLQETISTEMMLLATLQSQNETFSNPIINQFCHVNEILSGQLLHLPNVKHIITTETVTAKPKGK